MLRPTWYCNPSLGVLFCSRCAFEARIEGDLGLSYSGLLVLVVRSKLTWRQISVFHRLTYLGLSFFRCAFEARMEVDLGLP